MKWLREVPRQTGLVIMLTFIGVLVSSLGQMDEDVSLASVAEVWGDVLADTDGLGLQVARVSTEEEVALGEWLHKRYGFQARQLPDDDPSQVYVATLGKTLAARVRNRDIPYRFHVVDLPMVNAFALPGGHVYITTSMLKLLESEAELAALLGHEIAHVDARHCIQRFQYHLVLKRQGMGKIGRGLDSMRREWKRGYNKYQEAEADALGLRLMAEEGYNPQAGPRLHDKLAQLKGKTLKPEKPTTPMGEVLGSVIREMGRYRRSHPDSQTRKRRLTMQAKRYSVLLRGEPTYEGLRNYRERLTKKQWRYAEEEIRGD